MCLFRHCRLICALTAVVGLAGAPAGEAADEVGAGRAVLKVVSDDNYPPYVFRDADGRLTGYLVDTWRLWEKKTGVRVDLLGSDWATARQRMAEGQADVIDTIFRTDEREKTLDFTPPYAPIPVAIYTHASIGGIVDLTTLRGFLIGAKDGDACVDKLASAGISSVQTFSSYQTLVSAAIAGRVRVFCLDEPPANYLLYLNNAGDLFNKAFTLYTPASFTAPFATTTATPWHCCCAVFPRSRLAKSNPCATNGWEPPCTGRPTFAISPTRFSPARCSACC